MFKIKLSPLSQPSADMACSFPHKIQMLGLAPSKFLPLINSTFECRRVVLSRWKQVTGQANKDGTF